MQRPFASLSFGGRQSERSATNAWLVDSSLHFLEGLRESIMHDSGLALHGPGGEVGDAVLRCGVVVAGPLVLATATATSHHITSCRLRPIGVRKGESLAGVAAWNTLADWLLRGVNLG